MKKINLMKSAAVAALFSLVALFGCNNNATVSNDYSANGQIFGYVTDTKGEPLSGVTIALGNQTTTTNQNGAFALTGVPANATEAGVGTVTQATGSNQKYSLTATKDGYLSRIVDDILVVETTDKSDAALLLGIAANTYKEILTEFAKQGSAGVTSITNGAAVATDGVILDTQNTNDTFKGMADAYATVLERYQNLSKTYESTFVKLELSPCNGYFEGTLKITKSPGKDITTDAASIKAAPEGVKVKLVSDNGYVYEAITDKDGKFKFEKLPVATNLTLKVEGFEATYESGEGENKVTETYYYSSDGASAWLYDNLQEATPLVINLDENSGAKYKADILLYSQPAKIIVTDTNLLQNTEVAPLALNTPVTFTFNKPMDYVELEATVNSVNDIGENAAYTWDETKKTVTITPKDGFWTAAAKTVDFQIKGRAQDGSTTFIKKTFNVTLDNVIKVEFADVSDETADKFTLTFDRELYNTDDVKVSDDKGEALELSWNKTVLTKPVLTVKARDGKFGKLGYHTFTIAGVKAKDQSTNLISYNKEYVSNDYVPFGFTTSFDGFKATGIEVVNKAEGNLSRAVVATTAQYLKITFNKNVGDVSNLKLKDVNGNEFGAEKYIKDNAVYISLSKVANNASISLSGTVTSTSGDTFDGNNVVTWADLLKNYNVKRAYVIAASNLYTEKAAINAADNNVVNKIKKGDKVILTFNNEIPADAVITTELYKDTNENIDATGYSATATADKNVVTVTLSETKPGETYYLALKIKSADGAELFSTASESFATGDYVKDIDVEKKIANNGYIKIEVDNVKLLEESSSKTTKAEDFSKSNKSSIVLQFNQDVTGYKAYLYVATNRNDVAKAFEDLTNADKAYFYDTKYEVSGDTITITPNASFSSGKQPAIAVYDEEGKWIELDKHDPHQPYQPYTAKIYANKLALNNIDVASIAITASKIDAFDPVVDTLYVKFDMPLNKYTSTLPQFKLYKKVDYGFGDIEWELVTTPVPIVKDDDTSTQYSFDDAKGGKKARINIGAVDFGYGKTVDYVLVATVNNMLIKSNTVTITKK